MASSASLSGFSVSGSLMPASSCSQHVSSHTRSVMSCRQGSMQGAAIVRPAEGFGAS